METVNNPQPKIPIGGHWVSERLASSLSIYASGGWFDIPNGWRTDSAGIVAFHAGSSHSLDAVLTIDGLTEAESHQGSSTRGWCKSTLVGNGMTVGFAVGGTGGWADWFKFRRMA
ncbi:hypothetical protein NU136_003807 [Salmonella enterica]|nr:hypothetical protein [Salmonella enterica]EDD4939545.1 hypothetical protein [Salmonella enterica subsp. enterica serovar Typhimurium]EEE1959022.1 hypothetical protein [Salmonella enterica subsp. enterica serovar Norwich]EBE7790358.1 hypothetical protein [Salmonella enterica]EBF1148342.1 hypothetical protein [Salmonella enterica]